MSIQINLAKPAARLLAIITIGGLGLLLGALALQQAITGMFVDERVAVPRQWLAAGLRYAPTSAPLLARLAESELAAGDTDLAACEAYARRAANLSPWDYRHQLLRASIAEAKGDRAAAEQHLLAARALAPRYVEVHWRMANLLVRQGRVAPALAEFRQVTSADRSLLPAAFDLLCLRNWRSPNSSSSRARSQTRRRSFAELTPTSGVRCRRAPPCSTD